MMPRKTRLNAITPLVPHPSTQDIVSHCAELVAVYRRHYRDEPPPLLLSEADYQEWRHLTGNASVFVSRDGDQLCFVPVLSEVEMAETQIMPVVQNW